MARRKAAANFDLSRVQRAMRDGQYQFEKSCRRDLDNLGYSDEELCDCVCSLTSRHFHKAYDHTDTGIVLDAYRTSWRRYSEELAQWVVDDLYIKFRLFEDANGSVVLLASFHRNR